MRKGAAGNRSAFFVAAVPRAGQYRHDLSAQLTHFGIHTTDLDRMVDFYTRVMGFVISDQGNGRSGARVVFMTQNLRNAITSSCCSTASRPTCPTIR